jgi:hypothetical protein
MVFTLDISIDEESENFISSGETTTETERERETGRETGRETESVMCRVKLSRGRRECILLAIEYHSDQL